MTFETKKTIAQAEPARLADVDLELVSGGRLPDKTAAKTGAPTVCCW